MVCNKCNHKLPDDSEFCQYCGNKIEITGDIQSQDCISLADDLTVSDSASKEALNAILEFQAKATVDAMQANAQSQPDNENDAEFGLVPEKPIFTLAALSVFGEKEYLNKLRTVSGEKIKYTRRGSTSVTGIHGMIDVYDTFLPSGEPYKTIYINMYGAKKSVSAPKGFQFATDSSKLSKTVENGKTKKPFNNKVLIAIVAASIAVVMMTIPLCYLLFHEHDYFIISSNAPMCTPGERVLECSRCRHTYTEYLSPSHAYSSATCTQPKVCFFCGETSGTALGHTNGASCLRCGITTFETLTYTGTGSKVIKNILIPDGRFILSGYAVKDYGSVGSFYVYLNYGNGNRAAYWIDSLYSGNQTMEKAVSFEGAIKGGILEIKADDNISWTIIIEAVGN